MSLMLDALKRIDKRRASAPSAPGEPIPAEELVAWGLRRPLAPWAQVEPSPLLQTHRPRAGEESLEAAALSQASDGDWERGSLREAGAGGVQGGQEPVCMPAIAPPEQHEASPADTEKDARPPDPSADTAPIDDAETGGWAEQSDPAYRDLAERILGRCPAGRSTALMVTCPSDAREKSVMVLPLAVALANRLQERVLLIDADFLRAEITRWFGLSGEMGLAEVLAGQVDWPRAICCTPVRYLSVLAGSPNRSRDAMAAGLLRLGTLLNDLGRHYRLMLLDAPAANEPLSVLMARRCHGVYLAVHLGGTTRGELRQAVRAIEGGGGHLLGCIVTEGR